MKSIALAIILIFVGFVVNASACQCLEYGVPLCEQVSRADAIFIGTVKSIQDPKDPKSSFAESHIRFEVEQVYKGSTDTSVDVGYSFGTSCSWNKFEIGQRWLVYGYRDKQGGGLTIPFCTNSHPYVDADEDTAFLSNLKQSKSSESIRGKLSSNDYGVLADIPVSVAYDKTTITGKSNNEGLWEISVPGPGKYHIKVTVPFSALLLSYDPSLPVKAVSVNESESVYRYDANVEKGLCSYKQLNFAEIDLKADASISGKVKDRNGNPVPKAYVYLAKWSVGETEVLAKTTFGSTDEEGNYKFEGLREGRYVVLTNENNYPRKSEPYLRSYLPGAPSFAGAFIIELEQGKEIIAPDFKLPAKIPTRKIEIQAVWPDGKPVKNWGPEAAVDSLPNISIYKADGKYIELAELIRSGEGKYTFSLFDGFPYIIQVSSYGSDDRAWKAYIKIPSKGSPKNLKVVLSQKPGDIQDFVTKDK